MRIVRHGFNYQNQYSDSRFYGTDLDDSSTELFMVLKIILMFWTIN